MFSTDAHELSFLTEQTFFLGQHLKKSDKIGLFFREGPGIMYFVDRGVSTFLIRGIPVPKAEDVSMDEIRELLRVEENCNIDFFPTQNIFLAETICENLVNRRLPIQEDLICNVSDPGFSWWLDPREDQIRVHFRSYGADRSDRLIRLGPMGDYGIAKIKFRELLESCYQNFGIEEFSLDDYGLVLSPRDTHSDSYKAFRRIFTNGEFVEDKFEAEASLKTYLTELAGIRSFWLQVENVVNQD